MRFFCSTVILASFICLTPTEFLSAAVPERLDPHGAKDLNLHRANLKEHSECSVCHFDKHGKLEVKAAVSATTCFNCHNKSPHSGVAEHLGRDFKNPETNRTEKITCLSCHSPHRAGSKEGPSAGHFFSKSTEPNISPQFKIAPKSNAMLQRVCTECHKW